MGLEVPDRFDRLPDIIAVYDRSSCRLLFKCSNIPQELARGQSSSLRLVGEMLLPMASEIRH